VPPAPTLPLPPFGTSFLARASRGGGGWDPSWGGGGGGGAFAGGGFGPRLTRSARLLLTLYGSVFVLELVLTYWFSVPVATWLALPPLLGSGGAVSKPWTLLTHHLVQDPHQPIGVLFELLAIWFFTAPLEDALGRRGFLKWWAGVAVGAAVFGLLLSLLPIPPLRELFQRGPFMGITPGVLAMVALFGLLHPQAQILLFFILPIRAIWITWITVGAVLIGVLTRSRVGAFYDLGGLLAGWILFRGGLGRLDPRLLWQRWKQYQLQRKLGRFKVIHGGRGGDPHGPTWH